MMEFAIKDVALLRMLGEAVDEARKGVLYDLEPDHMGYEKLASYEQEEMNARAEKVIEALATYYGMDIATLLQVLAQYRGNADAGNR